MAKPDTPSQHPDPAYDVGHTHPDISGGWLRAATFGAMDGLVSNTALIAGVAAADSVHAVTVSGIARQGSGRPPGLRVTSVSIPCILTHTWTHP